MVTGTSKGRACCIIKRQGFKTTNQNASDHRSWCYWCPNSQRSRGKNAWTHGNKTKSVEGLKSFRLQRKILVVSGSILSPNSWILIQKDNMKLPIYNLKAEKPARLLSQKYF